MNKEQPAAASTTSHVEAVVHALPESVHHRTVEELLKEPAFSPETGIKLRLLSSPWFFGLGQVCEKWVEERSALEKWLMRVDRYAPGFIGKFPSSSSSSPSSAAGGSYPNDDCRKLIDVAHTPGIGPREEGKGGVVAVVTKPIGGPTIRWILALIQMLTSMVGVAALVAWLAGWIAFVQQR